MTSLVLFCGGDPIYPTGVPKPLQEVRRGQTLLELYLDTANATGYEEIVVLCESRFAEAFRDIAERTHTAGELTIRETSDGSTTLTKLLAYLEECPNSESPIVWTYPDIFYFGSLSPPIGTEWRDEAVISLRPIASRFPRIVMDPFALKIRSISRRQSSVPANPAHLFGGHLIASPAFLSSFLGDALSQVREAEPSLEFDVFSWMISRGLVNALPLQEAWLKTDGPRDLRDVLAMIENMRLLQFDA